MASFEEFWSEGELPIAMHCNQNLLSCIEPQYLTIGQLLLHGTGIRDKNSVNPSLSPTPMLGEKCSLRQGQSNKVVNFAIYLVRGPNQQTISLLRGNGAENAARSAFASLLCYVMNTMTCNRK